MKRWNFLSVIMLLAITLFSAISSAEESKVCWKPTYGRGVGAVPTACPGGQNDAGLCYEACPPGWTGVGPVCHQNCPPGFGFATAADISCSKPNTYTRGAHALIFGGPENCAREAEGRGCEQFGALLYPRPKPGYQCGDAGLICSATCPPGYSDQGLFCGKQPARGRGVGTVPKCNSAQQYDAGLCYQGCNAGFYGVGPVCWGQCPKAHPIDCGAMCGKSADECAKAITEQVVGVLEVIANIASTVATAGAGAGATAGANAAKQAAMASGKETIKRSLQQTAKTVAKSQIKETVKKLAKDAGKDIASGAMEELTKAAAGEDFDFTALDPTGIASMIKNFVLPMCASDVPLPQSQGPTGALNKTMEGKASAPAAADPRLSVLDAGFYLTKYPDLRNAFGNNVQAAQKHWLDYGIREGRQSAAGFDIRSYLGRYPDLQKAFGTDYTAALNHWFQYGQREGRNPAPALATGTLVTSEPRTDGAIYMMDAKGAKRPIANPQVFNGCGLDWNAVQKLPPAAMNALPSGPALQNPAECQAVRKGESKAALAAPTMPTGTLVTSEPRTDGAIYMVDAKGAKRPIANPQVFNGCSLDWNAVQKLTPAAMNTLPSGPALQNPGECQTVRKGESASTSAAPSGPASYGRGAGYALWDEAKCSRENKQGCEKDGAIFYPKCNAGYKGVGPVCWKQ